jgi:hypothetical protein
LFDITVPDVYGALRLATSLCRVELVTEINAKIL